MKQTVILILSLLLLSTAALALSNEQVAGFQAEYIPVSKSVIMVKHEYGSNLVCIAVENGLYFIDCGMSTELARRFRRDMEKKFNQKTQALLLTHAHIDQFLGMAAFSDVKVIAAEIGKPLWQKQLAIKFTDERIKIYAAIFPKFAECIKSAKPFLPHQWFKNRITLGEGKGQFTFVNTGGHSSCSSSVFFTEEGVLVAGDLIQVDQYPYFGDPSNDMKKWIQTLTHWQSLPIKKVCGGHGKVESKAYIKTMNRYFKSLIVALTSLKEKNTPVKEVIGHSSLPPKYWPVDLKKPRWFDYCIVSLYNAL